MQVADFLRVWREKCKKSEGHAFTNTDEQSSKGEHHEMPELSLWSRLRVRGLHVHASQLNYSHPIQVGG